MNKGWELIMTGQCCLDIIPIEDRVSHNNGSWQCGCQPQVSYDEGWFTIVHNAFDGRE